MSVPLPRLVLLALLAPLAACGADDGSDPGSAAADRQQITLTAQQTARVDRGAEKYADYVRAETDLLLAGTARFVAAYKKGDDEKARALYAPTRMHWEAIEPVAETFGDLDPRTDAREADLAEGDEWAGWHLIEKDLWPAAADAGYTPLTDAERTEYADRLLADLSTLKGEVADADYTGEQIAKGAKELLDEVANGKVTGEEEFWSHTDLYDFQANVDGAKTSFDVLTPVVDETDPELAQTLTTRFTELQTLLDQHRDSDGFESYTALTDDEVKALSDAVNALSEPLANLAAAVAPAVTRRPTVSRRGLLGVGAGTAVGLAAGAGGVALVARDDDPVPLVPFHGAHQAGIVTPAQDRLHFAAFDVTTDDRAELVALLERWTAAAEALTAGRPVGDAEETPYNAPPRDTGEAGGLSAARLTLTFGFGPGLFRDGDGRDRFGLADRRPRALERLPHFPADQLDPARSDGDLCVQACADDPQVAVHAIRNLARLAFGTAAIRWSQLGFGRTSSTSRAQATPRNLFGFKDGTANLKSEDAGEVSRHVWVAPGDDPGAGWLAGGSYLVARRISMSIETWDRTSLSEQEALVGRDRPEGAPLSGGREHTDPDFAARGADGSPAIAMDAHVRLAHPEQNGGVRMLRRGYNFTDGTDGLGRLDAGLFFLAFVRDPARQYVPMQTRLARQDGLSEYLTHTGSGLWAVPPGIRRGEYVGQALFA